MRKGVKLYCGWHRPCKFQSMRTYESRGNPDVKCVPRCLWESTCNQQYDRIEAAFENRKKLALKEGLKYCPKCMTYHL